MWAICIIGAVLARTGISALLYTGAVFTALFFGFLDGVVAMCPGFTALPAVLSHIPLYSMGFGWVIPTIIMSVAGGIIYRNKPRKYYDIESGNVFVKEQA